MNLIDNVRLTVFVLLVGAIIWIIPKNAQKTLKWITEMPFEDL